MRVLLFFLACLTVIPAYSGDVVVERDVSYDEVMAEFEASLYRRQTGLMQYKQYKKFIKPYIQEAEEKLLVSSYIRKYPHSELSTNYLDCLLDYNVACFRHHVASKLGLFKIIKEDVEDHLDIRYKNLFQAINNIEQATDDKMFDSTREMNKTVELIKRVNFAYYKKLGIGFKLESLLSFLFVRFFLC